MYIDFPKIPVDPQFWDPILQIAIPAPSAGGFLFTKGALVVRRHAKFSSQKLEFEIPVLIPNYGPEFRQGRWPGKT